MNDSLLKPWNGHDRSSAPLHSSTPGSNGCVAESPGDYVEGSPAYANHKYLLEGSFGRSDDEVVLRTTREFQQYYDQTYRFESGVWRFVGVKAVTSFATLPNRAPLSIALRQGPNTPPSLWATDRASGAGKQIFRQADDGLQ